MKSEPVKIKSSPHIEPFIVELSLSPSVGSQRVLVVGCGSGLDAVELSETGSASVTAVESSGPLIAQARARSGRVDFQEKNLLFFAPPSQSFDAVWIPQAINRFGSDQAQRIVASMFQALMPKGLLGLIVEIGDGSYERLSTDEIGAPRIEKVFLYPEKALCAMIEQSGFRITQIGRIVKDDATVVLVLARK